MDGGIPSYFNFAHDVMDRWAQQAPQAFAMWCVDENRGIDRKITFAELAQHYRRAQSFFQNLGIRRGDRVLLMLPRVPQWWFAMLGLIRLGAIPIPGTPLLTEKDIAYRLSAASVNAVITDDTCASKLDKFEGQKIIVGSPRPGWTEFDRGIADANPDAAFEPTRAEDSCLIYFTSGTTGQPKMALHTQISYGLAHHTTGKYWLDLKPGDLHWVLADPGWGKVAWSGLFGPWHMGACIFVDLTFGKFHPKATLRTLSQYPINTFCAPPTALRLLVCEDFSTYRFPHLRHCVAAGECLTASLWHKWKQATGFTIHEGYGQTETIVLVGNFPSLGYPVKPGSMGRCTPGFELAVVDDDMNPLPPDQEGQLAIRVKPNRPMGLFKEYWRDPEQTASRFRKDYYLTGDVVRCDADGYYWFISRADDVINSASYRIGPFEVESALAEHPAVLECAVVGAPDELRGEVVKAFIVVKPNFEPTESLKREIQEHCKRVTAPYKYPRQIEFISEMPKTTSGKIRRTDLRQRSWQQV